MEDFGRLLFKLCAGLPIGITWRSTDIDYLDESSIAPELCRAEMAEILPRLLSA